jgi:hypothetical protein
MFNVQSEMSTALHLMLKKVFNPENSPNGIVDGKIIVFQRCQFCCLNRVKTLWKG